MSPSKPDAGALGVLGGTFDPIHFGHLRLAEEAREALGLAQVALIPAGQPPHRDVPQSPATDRLAMVRLASAGNPGLAVDDGEVFAPSKSYTVLTLERLRALHGAQRPLVLILGADAFNGLPGWYRWQELFGLAHIAVANRPGFAPHGRRWPGTLSPELDAACAGRIDTDPAVLHRTPAGRVVPFDMTPLAISASLIRDLIHGGHSARYLLPDSVLDYIGLHHLYRRT
ncbi:nicotinate (nicotinamide) nucleotide adenylyltransferase [Azoarcus sp. CIB]|uniref:nicotinate-nucleotide adenylyltransferase n=1 Tax=Aromatoleum sp. (strain CIB) TaxID=198107 RepID=UPI00067E0A60|nr:nicotinate-nucleotide adenylyltransferase [Azoarcus sp. CIB]AKU10389.1 nicotinate (nicotinamide) nucleotide adenylyltransferase [Azoarcus sp. CIB]